MDGWSVMSPISLTSSPHYRTIIDGFFFSDGHRIASPHPQHMAIPISPQTGYTPPKCLHSCRLSLCLSECLSVCLMCSLPVSSSITRSRLPRLASSHPWFPRLALLWFVGWSACVLIGSAVAPSVWLLEHVGGWMDGCHGWA